MVLELTGRDSDQMALLPCTSTEPALWALRSWVGAGLEALSHRGPERLQGHGCPRQGDTAVMQYPLVEACCDPTRFCRGFLNLPPSPVRLALLLQACILYLSKLELGHPTNYSWGGFSCRCASSRLLAVVSQAPQPNCNLEGGSSAICTGCSICFLSE